MTTATKRILVAGFALVSSLSLFTASTIADASKARKKTAEVLAKEVSRLRFQNLYVADFLDPLVSAQKRVAIFLQYSRIT